LDKNAIIRLENGDKEEVSTTDCSTSLIFETILIEKDKTFFAELTVEKLKESIIKRYLAQFCENKENLPEITIQSIIDDGVDKDLTITSDDIPTPDKNRDISVCYSIIAFLSKKICDFESVNMRLLNPVDELLSL
jgi:hypothetical protein